VKLQTLNHLCFLAIFTDNVTLFPYSILPSLIKQRLIVLPYHPTESFEGLGLRTWLAFLKLPLAYRWILCTGALVFSTAIPLGTTISPGVRSAHNPGSTAASIVAGALGAVTAGILICAGLSEASRLQIFDARDESPLVKHCLCLLLTHDFLSNSKMHTASMRRVTHTCRRLLGAALMSLLGRCA
jgi:hypothetical protein